MMDDMRIFFNSFSQCVNLRQIYKKNCKFVALYIKIISNFSEFKKKFIIAPLFYVLNLRHIETWKKKINQNHKEKVSTTFKKLQNNKN